MTRKFSKFTKPKPRDIYQVWQKGSLDGDDAWYELGFRYSLKDAQQSAKNARDNNPMIDTAVVILKAKVLSVRPAKSR